jgi:uncharacterized protein
LFIEMLPYEALVIGLMGSFHCMGMCGPIALALPLKQTSWTTRFFSTVLYNSGRVITYILLGIVLGLVGQRLALWGVQRWVSIGTGSVMILVVLLSFFGMKSGRNPLADGWSRVLNTSFGKIFASQNYFSPFLVGLVNGLLPCGLVYIALAGALMTPDAFSGALYMFLFGIGTAPALMALTLAGNIVSLPFRNRIRKILPWLIILIGLLFILRGMNLGIKYVSPKMEKPGHAKCCHE